MEIEWKDEKTMKYLTNHEQIQIDFDKKVKDKLFLRYQQFISAKNLGDMPSSARVHPVDDLYAVDLPHIGSKRGKYRLLFELLETENLLDPKQTTKIKIIKITDYH